MLYKDRQDAGQQLANTLINYKDRKPVVIALPRGGIVLGYEVAKALNAPLDIIVARKIGAPFQPEFGIGAIAPNGVCILDDESVKFVRASEAEIKRIVERETAEMNRRIKLYRGELPPPDLAGKTVIIVDDGLATGVTARAAVFSARQMNPEKIILAVPVSSPITADRFRKEKELDKLICLSEPSDFYAVGACYENFEQVTDEEVINLLKKSKEFINPL